VPPPYFEHDCYTRSRIRGTCTQKNKSQHYPRSPCLFSASDNPEAATSRVFGQTQHDTFVNLISSILLIPGNTVDVSRCPTAGIREIIPNTIKPRSDFTTLGGFSRQYDEVSDNNNDKEESTATDAAAITLAIEDAKILSALAKTWFATRKYSNLNPPPQKESVCVEPHFSCSGRNVFHAPFLVKAQSLQVADTRLAEELLEEQLRWETERYLVEQESSEKKCVSTSELREHHIGDVDIIIESNSDDAPAEKVVGSIVPEEHIIPSQRRLSVPFDKDSLVFLPTSSPMSVICFHGDLPEPLSI